MPALSGIEEKYFDGYKVDKENENVVYSDEKHVYIDKVSKEVILKKSIKPKWRNKIWKNWRWI